MAKSSRSSNKVKTQYGILVEGRSDVDMIRILIQRIAGDLHLPVHPSPAGGAGKLVKEGASRLRKLIEDKKCTRLVIARDADGKSPESVREEIRRKVLQPVNLNQETCIVVPVQAIEAWVLADHAAVKKVIENTLLQETKNPESVKDPKAELIRNSRVGPRNYPYIPKVHDAKVAEHLNLDLLYTKCPSFRPLRDFVRQWK